MSDMITPQVGDEVVVWWRLEFFVKAEITITQDDLDDPDSALSRAWDQRVTRDGVVGLEECNRILDEVNIMYADDEDRLDDILEWVYSKGGTPR